MGNIAMGDLLLGKGSKADSYHDNELTLMTMAHGIVWILF